MTFIFRIRRLFDKNTGILRKLEFLLLRLFCELLGLMTDRGLRRFSRMMADFSFTILRVRKRTALSNLKNAFPEKSDQWIYNIARLSQQNLFISLFEFLASQKSSPDRLSQRFNLKNIDVIHNALRKKRGIIFMTGHFGNWELLAVATMVIMRMSGLIIVKKQRNHYVDQFINDLRTHHTNRIVYMKESVRAIIKELNENGIVAMVADQSAPRDSVYVPFFGREVATYGGPAYFALRTGAPIVMGFSVRQPDGNYDALFEEVKTEDLEDSDKDAIRELTARHTALLEEYVRKYPDQWLWQHRRWKYIKEI